MGEVLQTSALLRLMAWLSPSFPVGAFSYSHGIEYAVEEGLVTDVTTLTCWVTSILRRGSGRIDSDIFRMAWLAAREEDIAKLIEVAEQASAFRGTSEMALENRAQGMAFVDTVGKAWQSEKTQRLYDHLKESHLSISYPVAVAVAAEAVEIPLKSALAVFLHAVVANLISAGVRLVPLGQTDGQRAMAALESLVEQAAIASLSRTEAQLGSAALMVEWTSMKHETQYTRLYRS